MTKNKQSFRVGTHYFISNIIVKELFVEVGGLVHVEAGVDLDPEVVPVSVVEKAFSLVQFDGLTLATF